MLFIIRQVYFGDCCLFGCLLLDDCGSCGLCVWCLTVSCFGLVWCTCGFCVVVVDVGCCGVVVMVNSVGMIRNIFYFDCGVLLVF